MNQEELYNEIIKAANNYQIPEGTEELLNKVITSFIDKKYSAKIAAKRAAALIANDQAIETFLNIFNAYNSTLTLSQFMSNLKPKQIKSGPWSPQEDKLLTEGYQKFGNDWSRVADYVGNGRTKSQCAQRWERSLDPSISREAWTEEEVKLLHEGVKKFGFGSWVKVSKLVGTRSDVQCRYKYKSIHTKNIGRPKPKKPRRKIFSKKFSSSDSESYVPIKTKEEDPFEKELGTNDHLSSYDKFIFNENLKLSISFY